ncbi:hypothetical protein [Cellulomonas sp. KH9]|uniref:hypothetical protein n=1 Tax=Cellulomonas sp. KH9 TaxID=1855324 RepID=UPI0008E1BC43|nr:hypothetical protein [Cellulomonas sp. KH9]SFJ98814.1 hypothetical protein SAMN05216467_1566 [Cellulomonas sp. KH9]
MRSARPAVAALVCAVALGLAACGGTDHAEDVDEACAASGELDEALDDLRATLTPDATVDELRDARTRVGDALDALRDQADDVAEGRADDVQAAWRDLTAAVDDVDGDAGPGAALEPLRASAADVRQSLEALDDDLGCATTPSP